MDGITFVELMLAATCGGLITLAVGALILIGMIYLGSSGLPQPSQAAPKIDGDKARHANETFADGKTR